MVPSIAAFAQPTKVLPEVLAGFSGKVMAVASFTLVSDTVMPLAMNVAV